MTEIVISPPPKKTYGQILAEKNMAQTPLFDIDALGPILTGDKLELHNLRINFNRTNGVFSPNSAELSLLGRGGLPIATPSPRYG